MQIFAYTECPEFQALLEIECKEITGVRPVVHNSLEDLKSLLSLFQSIDILIMDFPEDLSLMVDVKEFIINSSDRIKHTLVLSNVSTADDKIKSFSRIEISYMFDELRSLFDPGSSPLLGWTAVPLCTLIHFETLPFDLFIKLSDNRYVKRVPAFEHMGSDFTQSLKGKNIRELYCEKKHNRDFSMMLINNMINRVDRSYDTIGEKLIANNEVLETTRQIILNLGLSGRIVEVCETAVEKMLLDVLDSPDEFSSYLLDLKNRSELSFMYKLISLTNYLGTQLIIDMKLDNQEEQLRKFIKASFFCDMCLENPAFIFYRKATDTESLTLEEQNDINFHALKASELMDGYRDTPKEVSLIIRQHHGSFSGIGFPAEKSPDLLPLSKILVVSQEMAFAILNDVETPARDIIQKFIRRHHSPGLTEILKVLDRKLLNKTRV